MLPTIDPILPVLNKKVPRGREWIYEAKLDGFRGTLYVENGKGLFRSKTKNRMKRFEDLANAIARALTVKSAIFDGEIVVMGEGGPDFYALMQARGVPSYAAFDLVWLNGKDLRPLSLTKRKAALRKVVKAGVIDYVEAVKSPALFEAAVRLDLEGIVAKRGADPYASETRWVKVKNQEYSQKEGRADLFHPRR